MRALFSLVRLFVNERLGATLHGTAQWFSLCSKELRCVESVGGGCDLLSKLPSFTETGIGIIHLTKDSHSRKICVSITGVTNGKRPTEITKGPAGNELHR
jgi:hypothetical protein